MSEVDEERISELHNKLQDPSLSAAQKQTVAKELISMSNKKVLSSEA